MKLALILMLFVALAGCTYPEIERERQQRTSPAILLCDEVPVMISKTGILSPVRGRAFFQSRETGAVFPLMPALICRVVPATPENMQKYQVEAYLSQGPAQ